MSIGWLIERYINNKLHFWSAGARGRGSADEWSTDVAWATRLADEASAAQVLIHVCGGQGRYTDHEFGGDDVRPLSPEERACGC